MIYLTSIIIMILVLAVYSISGIMRNREEIEFKKNIIAINEWHQLNRGNKDV